MWAAPEMPRVLLNAQVEPELREFFFFFELYVFCCMYVWCDVCMVFCCMVLKHRRGVWIGGVQVML